MEQFIDMDTVRGLINQYEWLLSGLSLEARREVFEVFGNTYRVPASALEDEYDSSRLESWIESNDDSDLGDWYDSGCTFEDDSDSSSWYNPVTDTFHP